MNRHVLGLLAIGMMTCGAVSKATPQDGQAEEAAGLPVAAFVLGGALILMLAVVGYFLKVRKSEQRTPLQQGDTGGNGAARGPDVKTDAGSVEDYPDGSGRRPAGPDTDSQQDLAASPAPETNALRAELAEMKAELQRYRAALRDDVKDIQDAAVATKEEVRNALNSVGLEFATMIGSRTDQLNKRIDALLAKSLLAERPPVKAGDDEHGVQHPEGPPSAGVNPAERSGQTPEDLVIIGRGGATAALPTRRDADPSLPQPSRSAEPQTTLVNMEDDLGSGFDVAPGEDAPTGELVTREGIDIAFGRLLRPGELARLVDVAQGLRGPEAVSAIFKELNQIGGERRLSGNHLRWPGMPQKEVLDFVTRHAGSDATLIWPAEGDRIEHNTMRPLPGASSGISKVKELVCPGYRLAGEEKPVQAVVGQF
jgi:hypothetical protein